MFLREEVREVVMRLDSVGPALIDLLSYLIL